MLDRSIPYYNIILKCNSYHPSKTMLPKGYYFRNYTEGDENAWARLEYEIGDFSSIDEARKYFIDTYCEHLSELKKRCIFAVNDNNKIIGSCIAWKDKKDGQTVSSLHWLVVSPHYQGKKIGTTLCCKTMELFNKLNEFPVYIHTQPWSYKTIFLYIHQGFLLQITDTFANYDNQYLLAMKTLKNILSKQQYTELVTYSE